MLGIKDSAAQARILQQGFVLLPSQIADLEEEEEEEEEEKEGGGGGGGGGGKENSRYLNITTKS
jgi:hypothetical protein